MKFLFRWIFRLVVLAILLVMALLLLKDALLKEVVESQLAAVTGLEVRIDRFEAKLLKPTVTIEGLRLYNPASFGGSPFLDVRELHVEYDRPALLRGEILLRLVRFDLTELSLVQDTNGRWNYEYVNVRLKASAREEDSPLEFGGIDVLNLSLGEVKRYRMANPSAAQVYRFHVHNEIFLGLRNPTDFAVAAGRLAGKLGLKTPPRPTNSVPAHPSR
jgi:uncharacterized protein involved in outer membrane biogenesis